MGQVMIITGGGRGIGAATARLAAARGYSIVVNYRRDGAAAQELVAELVAAGGQAQAIAADVSVERDVERLFAETDASLGRVDVLVNNAGIVDVMSRLSDMGQARLQRMFAVNVIGSMLCAREAVRRMSTRSGGSGGCIVNVSSAAARLGSPGSYVDYAASKGAIDTFTLGLAQEVAAEGIRVNAVRPGIIETDIHADSGDRSRPSKMAHVVPIQRPGDPEEVARAILWLAGPEASYCTGSLLDVAGGR